MTRLPQNYDCSDRFAPSVVWQTHDGAFVNMRMFQEGGFNLEG